jgi:hypothetical protein
MTVVFYQKRMNAILVAVNIKKYKRRQHFLAQASNTNGKNKALNTGPKS